MTDKTMTLLQRAFEVVHHEAGCPSIGGNGDKDCRCDAVPFLHDLKTHLSQTAELGAAVAEVYRNDGQTHAEGCHTWGPKHYECLVEKYKQCFNDSKRLKALEQAIDEIGTTGISDADQINIRADEIMRGVE